MNNKHFMIRRGKAEISNCKNQPKGFTLIELMIAMAVGFVLLGAVYAVYVTQNKELHKQEQIAEMQQNARMAMDMMSREIMMAGYGRSCLTIPTPAYTRCPGTTCLGISAANANDISFSADLNGNGNLTDPNENITYDRGESPSGSGIYALRRNSQPVVENIYPSSSEPALAFTYVYATQNNSCNGPGAPYACCTGSNAGTCTGNSSCTGCSVPYACCTGSNAGTCEGIRTIQITITTRTANIDLNTGNYRYYTLTSYVTPRNLGMSGF